MLSDYEAMNIQFREKDFVTSLYVGHTDILKHVGAQNMYHSLDLHE